MITHQEYMQDSTNLHHKYYGQFVNDGVKKVVLATFDIETLVAAFKSDKWLNNLPLHKWDLMGGFVFKYGQIVSRPSKNSDIYPVDYNLLKEANEGVSAATMVCIYKAAARMLIEEYESKKGN